MPRDALRRQPPRASGTDETSAIDVAVTATRKRGDQIRVRERRRPPGAEPAGEAVGDQVQPLQRERERDALAQLQQPPPRRRTSGSADPAPREHEPPAGSPSDERAVQRRAPSRTRSTPCPTSASVSDDAGDRRRPRSRTPPSRSRRARRARSPRGRRRSAPPPRATSHGRSSAASPRVRRCPSSSAREPVRPGDRDAATTAERHRERDRPRPDLAGEPPVPAGRDEPRQDDHAQGARDEHEREVDARRRRRSRPSLRRAQTCATRMTPATAAEPLTAAVEIPVSRPLRTALRPRERLPSIHAGDDSVIWSEESSTRCAREFGDAYAGRTVPRHRRGRLHGLAPDRRARPSRRRTWSRSCAPPPPAR